MKNIKINLLILFVATAVWLTPKSASAEIAVIANVKGLCKAVSKEEIQKLFLAKTRSCSDQVVQLVEPDMASPVRKDFLAKVVNKNASEYKAYWSILIFTGRARPPHEVKGDHEVKAWVADNEAAIGYIDSSSVDKSVQVIGTIR